jgi:hypothetical protein
MLNDPWTRSRSDDCLSDLALDQLRAGELDDEQTAAATRHLESCSRCASRRETLAELAREIGDALPPLPSTDAPESAPPRRAKLTAVLGTLAAAAAVVLLVRSSGEGGVEEPSQAPVDDRDGGASAGVRTKGGFSIGFAVRRDGRVFEGQSGEVVLPGDALRFSYSSVRDGHLAIISVDGAQVVTAYYPASDAAAPASSASRHDLDGSVVLDDTVGEEVVFGVLCRSAVPVESLKRAIERSPTAPRFPSDCEVDPIVLDKREHE